MKPEGHFDFARVHRLAVKLAQLLAAFIQVLQRVIGAMGLGISPLSGTCGRTLVGSGTGAVASSAFVYGWRGAA